MLSYPNNGYTYTHTYDAAGRPNGLTHVEGGFTIPDASNVVYNAAGAMTSFYYKADGFDYTQTSAYNNRGQLTNLTITRPGATVENLQYNYPAVNAGRIESMQNVLSGETVTYQYDVLSRLTTATAQIGANPQWSQQYTYDGFGNLYKKTGTGLAAPWNFDHTGMLVSGKNQIGTAYDANGNPTGLSFDIENRVTAQFNYTFGYAPDNKRVVRVKSAAPTINEVHFYSGNNRLGRYRVTQLGPGEWQVITVQEERYFAGRRLAPQDRLGSAADARLLPYGEEITATPTPNDRTKFATYFRDDWGYDYADQRYYNQGSGRFLTVDPMDASAKRANPGSWNRYAYVEGDPVNYHDSSGLARSAPNHIEQAPKPPPPTPTKVCSDGSVVPLGWPCPNSIDGPSTVGSDESYENWAKARDKAYAGAKLIQNKRNFSDQCEKTLNDAGISPKSLSNGLEVDARSQLQAAAAGVTFFDGTTSTTLVRDLYANASNPNLARLIPPTQTVAQAFAASPSTSAMAMLGGNFVFINPEWFNYYGDGYATAVVIHELLHNITGLTDSDLQRNLGLSEVGGSINITLRLLTDCLL